MNSLVINIINDLILNKGRSQTDKDSFINIYMRKSGRSLNGLLKKWEELKLGYLPIIPQVTVYIYT